MRVSNAFIVLCLLLGTLQVRAADVVIMRDGSERSGTLELCADDQCRLSGKRIPIEEIRAIFLDGPRKELPVRSSAIVMRDGSVRTGRVTFINRGTVDTDNEEFDRSRVAAIIFSGASDKPLSDLLILRNGSVKSGALTTCNAASCTLDGAITPLANIEWVGLAREDLIPPSSTADEVHKIDGTIVPGRLSGINESRVSTTRGPVLRAETAWVHLAEPAPTQPDQPGSFGAPPPPPQPPPPPSPPPQPPVQPPQPPQPPPPQPPPQPPPRPETPSRCGALWTGTMHGVHQAGGDGVTTDVRVRICETRLYVLPKRGLFKGIIDGITLVDAGSTLTRTHWTDPNHTGSCTDSGQGTSPAISLVGEINRVLQDVGRNGELKWSAPTYHVSLAPAASLPFTTVCRNDYGTQRNTYEGGKGGRPVQSGPERWLPLDGGRMVGSYVDGTERASWSICREGVPCPAAPSSGGGGGPAPSDRCSDGPQLAFARLCRDELARQIDQLKPKLAEYTRLQKVADQFWPDFKWAAAQCAAWKVAQLALETILGGEAKQLGQAGANAERVIQVLQAMIEGDYGGLVLDVDSFEERDEFKYGLENTKKVLDALDKAGSGADLLSKNLLGIGAAGVESCLGAVTPELHRKAELFIEYSKQAATYYAEHVAPARNNIRSKSIQCLQKDYLAWRACREAAECRGEASEGCGPDPHEIFNEP